MKAVAVRNASSAARPARWRAALVGFLVALVNVALVPCGVAVAGTVTTDFEAFAQTSVNGQDGWKSAPPGSIPSCNPNPTGGAYDQQVVPNAAGAPQAFGRQSLRMSNRCGSGEFFFQTYSKPAVPAAGEDRPGTTEYTAQFSFKAPAAPEPGLFISVSPDSYEGSRMSWVGLEDTAGGTEVTVSDTPNVDGDFADYNLGTLDRGVPHTIKFSIKLNPGEDNDLVRIAIDGRDTGQCFTTWENYYRTAPEQSPPPNKNTPANINSLQFRSSVPAPQLAAGSGYLFDNVSITTANGPGPADCKTVIDKQADTPTVTAGGRVGYQITVRNRGDATAQNVRVCDRIPRRTTFVSADRGLRALAGRGRCLLIARLAPGQRVRLHLELRVAANAPQGTITNTADVTPGVQPTVPAVPAAEPAGAPAAPGARQALARAALGTRVQVRRARAIVRVRARRARPNFTG